MLKLTQQEIDMMELNNKMVADSERQKALLLIGKWIADNIVALGALVVSIIALLRTC